MIRRLILIALFWTFSLPAAAENSRFLSALSDIPLMPGLYELAEETVIFDKPEGRIVESSAASETKNINEIKDFYDSALPQLGWTRGTPSLEGDLVYFRQDETLRLRIGVRSGVNVIEFMVFPR